MIYYELYNAEFNIKKYKNESETCPKATDKKRSYIINEIIPTI